MHKDNGRNGIVIRVGQSEVDYLHTVAIGSNHYVVGLQVTMYYLLSVNSLQSIRNLKHNAPLRCYIWRSGKILIQTRANNILHQYTVAQSCNIHEVDIAHDVRVIQAETDDKLLHQKRYTQTDIDEFMANNKREAFC